MDERSPRLRGGVTAKVGESAWIYSQATRVGVLEDRPAVLGTLQDVEDADQTERRVTLPKDVAGIVQRAFNCWCDAGDSLKPQGLEVSHEERQFRADTRSQLANLGIGGLEECSLHDRVDDGETA